MNRHDRRAAQAASNPQLPSMEVVRNGDLNQAVNFATEDFYKAAIVLKNCTKNYTVKYADMPRGMQSFVQQQFWRLNGAGLMLDALGFQSVTEVLALLHSDASNYMQTTMAEWNEVIQSEGDVERMFKEIEATERAAGKQMMQ